MPAVSSVLLGLSAAASLGSGVVGALQNASASDRAKLLQEQGVQEWLKLNIPDIDSQKLALEEFVRTGKMDPKLEATVKPLDSQFAKIQQDPRLKETRMRALQAMEEQAYGGEQVQDTAARQQALIDSGAKSRGQQEAITSSMARRGQLGSGLELAARQNAAQAEGDRLASTGLDIESQRRDRALRSMAGAATAAGDLANTDFAQKSAAAQAQDAINLFNTKNTQSVLGKNVDRSNEAQTYNLNLDQDIANKNTGVRNYEQEKNKALIQQQFDNQKAKTAGLTGQYGEQADQANKQGQSAANMWGGIASGIGTAGVGGAKIAAAKEEKAQKEEDELF